jgi:hypothetical protein
MSLISKYLAKRIVVDAYPSKFIFTRMDNGVNFSIATFVYLGNNGSGWTPLAIGEEIPREFLTPDVHKFELFESPGHSPPASHLGPNALLQIFFEYGIGKCLGGDFLPNLRPVVFVLGANRFTGHFEDPKVKFDEILKRAGAAIVVFDKTEV